MQAGSLTEVSLYKVLSVSAGSLRSQMEPETGEPAAENALNFFVS